MKVDWRTLWRLPDPLGGEDRYISLDMDRREAHILDNDAPVVKLARVYHETLYKCRSMSGEQFSEYFEKWQGRRAELEARDLVRAGAFFTALDEAHNYFKAKAKAYEDGDLAYLYDEQEQP